MNVFSMSHIKQINYVRRIVDNASCIVKKKIFCYFRIEWKSFITMKTVKYSFLCLRRTSIMEMFATLISCFDFNLWGNRILGGGWCFHHVKMLRAYDTMSVGYLGEENSHLFAVWLVAPLLMFKKFSKKFICADLIIGSMSPGCAYGLCTGCAIYISLHWLYKDNKGKIGKKCLLRYPWQTTS